MNAPSLLFLFLFLGFWAWMIVECAAFESNVVAKILWLILLVPCGPVVGVPYYLIRVLPRVLKEAKIEQKIAV